MRLFPHPSKVKHKLLEEFKGKKILDLGSRHGSHDLHLRDKDTSPFTGSHCINHDLTKFPWPIQDNSYDLVICQHVIEHLPDTVKSLEELNRITAPGGKVLVETPHYTWFEAYRHYGHKHHFSFGSFDYFLKGNPYYKTDFHIADKYIFFDDLTFLLGIGFLANLVPRLYEKRLAFIFPATSFHVTFRVDKDL